VNCAKCGSPDIYTRLVAKRPDEWISLSEADQRRDEHLWHHCRGCGFGWSSQPLDAKLKELKMQLEMADGCLDMIREVLTVFLGEDSMKGTPAMMYPEAIRSAMFKAQRGDFLTGEQKTERDAAEIARTTRTPEHEESEK
jgi:hypothetical protein